MHQSPSFHDVAALPVPIVIDHSAYSNQHICKSHLIPAGLLPFYAHKLLCFAVLATPATFSRALVFLRFLSSLRTSALALSVLLSFTCACAQDCITRR